MRLPKQGFATGQAVAGSLLRDYPGLTIQGLAPGTLVSAKVRAALQDGLLLSFLTYFTATVDHFHLKEVLTGFI